MCVRVFISNYIFNHIIYIYVNTEVSLDHPSASTCPLRSRPNLHRLLRWLFLWARWKTTFIHFCMLSHHFYLSFCLPISMSLSHTNTFFLSLSAFPSFFLTPLALYLYLTVCLSICLSVCPSFSSSFVNFFRRNGTR